MACETAKEAWDKLKEEFLGSDMTRQMQVLNLRREFEVFRMKESETVKEYTDKLVRVANQIRLLGEELTGRRIVEKVLVSVSERFESKVSSLEDSKDISKLTLTKVINALQAFEQRRAIRLEETKTTEGAFQAKLKGKQPSSSGGRNSGAWLIDSGCTNYMTYDVGFFKELDRSYTSKVKIGNGDYVDVMGKGVVTYRFSDFPLPSSITEDFPNQHQVFDYIQSYAQHFDLLKHIRFNTKVVGIEYDQGLFNEDLRSWSSWNGNGQPFHDDQRK
ncbi:hypothetical protein EZV62_024563 [Acer yangbiense]|uniref:Retrovirus-related Pol polyprotein from transposon TNT 1-94-like beta-barrel domain-containing protein n=1 Tax=Acer yangbiense TaxID=1000413 RepID=A0A5C7GVF5_9ROSI|nr:hypothetical protein EZV62_024563 [Acer yangbiense]